MIGHRDTTINQKKGTYLLSGFSEIMTTVARTIYIVVGKNVKHPNSLQHQIQWIELYARTKMLDTIKIGRANFAPGTSPDALFRLIYFGKYREFCALTYCNVHGLWQNCIEIREELRLTAGCRREKCLQEGFGV